MKFYNTTLENGLTLIGEYRETAVSVGMGFFVKTGARDETPEVSGVSHFLEHMMFKGTEKRSALDITYQLGAIGAQANAYTSEETTVYYAAVLPEYFEDVFELLSDMLRPSLDAEEFATEKKVILEEIALYQDRPAFVLFETAMREYFKNHTAGNSVLGTVDSISPLTAEQMRAYFDARYAAGNMVLAVSGQFDWDNVVELANRYCGAWEKQTASREILPHTPVKHEHQLSKESLQGAHLCYVGPGPSATNLLRYPAYLLGCVLGDQVGSRAYWELVDTGLAEAVNIDVDVMDGTGAIFSYAATEPDNMERVDEKLHALLLDAGNFSDNELERAKTKLGTRLVLNGESSMRRLMAIGNNWVYREEYVTLDEELDRLQSVKKEDVQSLLDENPFTPYTKVTLVPA